MSSRINFSKLLILTSIVLNACESNYGIQSDNASNLNSLDALLAPPTGEVPVSDLPVDKSGDEPEVIQILPELPWSVASESISIPVHRSCNPGTNNSWLYKKELAADVSAIDYFGAKSLNWIEGRDLALYAQEFVHRGGKSYSSTGDFRKIELSASLREMIEENGEIVLTKQLLQTNGILQGQDLVNGMIKLHICDANSYFTSNIRSDILPEDINPNYEVDRPNIWNCTWSSSSIKPSEAGLSWVNSGSYAGGAQLITPHPLFIVEGADASAPNALFSEAEYVENCDVLEEDRNSFFEENLVY